MVKRISKNKKSQKKRSQARKQNRKVSKTQSRRRSRRRSRKVSNKQKRSPKRSPKRSRKVVKKISKRQRRRRRRSRKQKQKQRGGTSLSELTQQIDELTSTIQANEQAAAVEKDADEKAQLEDAGKTMREQLGLLVQQKMALDQAEAGAAEAVEGVAAAAEQAPPPAEAAEQAPPPPPPAEAEAVNVAAVAKRAAADEVTVRATKVASMPADPQECFHIVTDGNTVKVTRV